MVDELDLLKKDWKKQENNFPQFSKEDIYPMLLKKSSSIIKWILIISVVEFVFWTLLTIVIEQADVNNNFKDASIESLEIILMMVNYLILIYFIVRFYLNYKAIKATDNAKLLMKRILIVRSTVKQYIVFNLSYIFLGTLILMLVAYYNNPDAFNIKSPIMLILALLLVMSIFIGILLLLYRLIYGRLTRRLKANYEKLKKLEV